MNNYISHWWQGSRQPSNSGRHSSGSPPVPAGHYLPVTRPAGANNIGPTRSRRLRDPWSFVLSPRPPRDTTRYNALAHTEPLSPSLVPGAPLMINNKPLPETSLELLDFYPEPPPSPELAIRVSDPVSSREMHSMLAEVAHFIQTKYSRVNNTLSFTWTKGKNLRGRIIFQNLFEKLNLSIRMGRQMIRPLESFQRMEFTVPWKVKDLEPLDVSFDSCAIANDCIDFSGATNLREFSWNGDFCLLASKCINLPLYNLKILKISGCFISVEEAISILHSCLNLTCAELGTVDNSVQRTTKTNIRISTSLRVQLRFLTDLTIVTNEQLESILQRIAWRNLSSLTLIIGGTGLVGIPNAISSLQNLGRLKLTLAGRVEDREYTRIRRLMEKYEEEY